MAVAPMTKRSIFVALGRWITFTLARARIARTNAPGSA
jgi:hypothetical protein